MLIYYFLLVPLSAQYDFITSQQSSIISTLLTSSTNKDSVELSVKTVEQSTETCQHI